MKKIITIILCLALGLNLLGGIQARAYTREGETKRTGYFDWNYLYNEDGTIEGVKITSFGPKTDWDGHPIEKYETPRELVYPESIEGYKVIAISTKVKWIEVGTRAIEKTIIPQYVEELTEGSWAGELVISDQNKNYCCENDTLYKIQNSKKIEIVECWTDEKTFTIPDTVKKIGKGAFNGVGELEKIVIPSNVEVIDELAFSGLKTLSQVTFMGAIKIEDSAFGGTGLKKVTIPNGSEVHGGAFDYSKELEEIKLEGNAKWIGKISLAYTNLKTYTIPKGTTKVYASMFWGCKNLKSVVIPSSVKKIEKRAFQDCVKLNKIKYNGTKKQWKKIKFNQTGNLCGKFAKIVTKNATWKEKVKLKKKIKFEEAYKEKKNIVYVEWNEHDDADGYQIKLKAGKHKIKKNCSIIYTHKYLKVKKNKKYKAYIRYYSVIGGKKYYSKWSKGKKVV